MKTLIRICMCLFLASNNIPLFASNAKIGAVKQISTPISAEMAESCGVSFRIQREIRAMLVEPLPTDPLDRCKIALTKLRESSLAAQKGVVHGYQELADLVLTVKASPVSARLPEFNFSPSSDIDKSLYVGQALTENARKLGYSEEVVKGFPLVTTNQARLYAGEAVIAQRKPNGSKLTRKRLDVVWGNDLISVGASVWCQPEKLRDCDFQQYVRHIFESMEIYHPR